MTGDEVAKRRATKAVAPSPPATSRRGRPKAGEEQRPPLWRWFTQQVAHSDPAKAAAARAVRERWDLPVTRMAKIDRALAVEESEHLVAFRMLLDDYRLTYDIEIADDDLSREIGSGGKLVPFAPETCETCHREAVPGTGKCGRHGGQWISPQDQANLSRRIHDRLLTSSEAALRVLQDLMDNGRSEQVRLMAATSILDRAGIGPSMRIDHTGEITIDVAEAATAELRTRLDRIASNIENRVTAAAIDAAAHTPPENVVDAEVVEA